ncbi:hypothetical protein SAMN06265222_110129 [Neorhodopirellula lusitana]|uniref:Uncharacterized protein n=1 Tax=Neorhodopirellula lusitana TaxID=445327 RepID=A0ABY1QCF5_9BACT|nr:hypothetical protein [Neorhodopirellula lusitana]SMP67261.1 hypothetical protein SAMN06265222_110129 [Neorhodopirellula lusitana]
MSINQFQSVEFFGGPIDGHVAWITEESKPFVFVKTDFHRLNNSPFAQLVRLLLFHGHPQLDRIAIYELGRRDGRLAYQYVRSTRAIEPVSERTADRLEVVVD